MTEAPRSPITIAQSITDYIDLVDASRSANTARTYHQALKLLTEVLSTHAIDIEKAPVSDADLQWLKWYLPNLRDYAAATESLYLTALIGYYEFLISEYQLPINLIQVRAFIKRRQRKVAPKIPPFPREQIEQVLFVASRAANHEIDDAREQLRVYRDAALLLTLADTGLRVSEATALLRGQLDWAERRAIVTIKGGREALVRFSERAADAIKRYHKARAPQDGTMGKPLATLPVFSRHDKGAGKKTKPISTVTARNIVDDWVTTALGDEAKGTITPHSFRHYFVTYVLRASGGNLRLAQELARHKNIEITKRYAHLSDDDLDRSYHEMFNE